MELFKLFGTIAINNESANQAIDDTVGKAKSSESSLTSTFKKVGTAIAGAFSVKKIIDFGVQSVNTLQGFEDSMLKVKSLSGATVEEYNRLSDAALNYGSTTAWTSQNVADAMGYMALAGFDTNQILSATPGILSLASASGEDLATVSDILTDAMTGFGDSASDATRYADVLATTQAKSNTTVGMLGEAFTYVSSLAGTYSYSLEDVSTALGVMANAGVKGSMAGTSLSSVITRLGTNTSGARDAIEKLGVQFYNSDGTARSLGDVLVDLCDATVNMTTEQKAAFASTVAGAEAQKGLLAILNQGSSAYTDLNQKLKESSGNADEMAGTLESGLGGAIRSLSSAWEGFKVKLAQKFEVPLSDLIRALANFITTSAIPALDGLVSAITPVVDALIKFGNWMKEGSAGAELLKVVIIAVTAAFTAWQTIAAAQSIWTKLTTGIAAAQKAFTALGAAMMANPIGAVIALIAALVAAFVYLWNNCEGFRNFWIDLWENIKQVIQTALGTIQEVLGAAWTAIQTAAEGVFSAVSETVSNFITGVQNFFQTLCEGAQAAWDTVCNVVQFAILFIQELLGAAVEILMIPWNFIWQNFGAAITSAWENFKQIISNALTVISTTIQNVWNAIVQFLTPILQGIANTFTSIWTAIQNTVQTVMNTISNVIQTVMAAIQSVFEAIWNTIKSVIQSVLNAIRSIVSSVWNSVRSVTTSVWNNVSSAISNAINTIKNVISSGLNAAYGTVSNIFNNIRNAISNVMNGAANIVSGAINRIKGFFNFSWSLPHLKMPHPYISGSFSLNPPSVPSFGIDWYAKGGILTEPTLFSMNPKTGRASVGGEAGNEAVAPIETLLTYIRTAVGEQNGDLSVKLDALIELLQQYFSAMLDNMQRGIVLDSGVLVGELAPAIDDALGEIYYRKGRE